MFEFDVRCIYGCVCFYNSTVLFLTVLRLAGMRACPRVRHARGLRARAHYAARDGWRARARAQKYSRGCGFVIPVSAGILPVAIFERKVNDRGEERIRVTYPCETYDVVYFMERQNCNDTSQNR